MTYRRKTAGWGVEIAGIVSILFGALVCLRSLERLYYAYGPATDDLNMRHVKVMLEIEAWAVTVAFVVSGFVLLWLAKTLRRSE